jgi:hypothetical protein
MGLILPRPHGWKYPAYEESKRQQALYKEHAEINSQASVCGKRWRIWEKHRVLVIDGLVDGRTGGRFAVGLRNGHSCRLKAAALDKLVL